MNDPAPEVAFLENIVKAIVDNPNEVKVSRRVDDMGVLLTLDINKADMGKVIGRLGATAQAIRSLLRIVGMRNNARINMKITDPDRGAYTKDTVHASDTVDNELKGI